MNAIDCALLVRAWDEGRYESRPYAMAIIA